MHFFLELSFDECLKNLFFIVYHQDILKKRAALRSGGLNSKQTLATANDSETNDRRHSNVLNLPKRGQSEAQIPSEMTSNDGRSSAGSASGIMSQK